MNGTTGGASVLTEPPVSGAPPSFYMPPKRPNSSYANAQEILPPRLLREVQRYHQGLLWIPILEPRLRRRSVNEGRDREIVRRHAGGVPIPRLARDFHLTPERIRQIVRPRKSID